MQVYVRRQRHHRDATFEPGMGVDQADQHPRGTMDSTSMPPGTALGWWAGDVRDETRKLGPPRRNRHALDRRFPLTFSVD